MNFFDYELSRTASATPPQTAADAPEPTLNEEVSQVVGQLGRLWGGFRKQSQVALATARKDLTSVVAQAQKEIEKLTTEPVASSSRTIEDGPQGVEAATPMVSAPTGEEVPQTSSPSTGSTPFQTLLSRVQSSLPPNISSTLERNIPASLKDSTGHVHVDIAQLRATLGTEFARVQGVTLAQAEEYVHKSETLLREAGEYIKDAVKVVPPEEDRSEGDVVFDGMGLGVVVMPPSIGSSGPGNRELASRSKGKEKETVAQARLRLAGSRAAAMLGQLKRDPEVIKQDPSEDDSVKAMYEAWLNDEVASKEGGIEEAVWLERVKAALTQKQDGDMLRSTRDALVPSAMDSNTFWTRYFFRVHQIEKDEEKRKALLAASGATGNEEDFSWENDDDDDDDESATPSTVFSTESTTDKFSTVSGTLNKARASSDTLQPGGKVTVPSSYPSSLVTSPSPSSTSPTESSDGYDVISAASAADVRARETKGTEKDEGDGDSDWE